MGTRRTNTHRGARPRFGKALGALAVVLVTAGVLAPQAAYATPGVPASVTVTLSKKCIHADNVSTTTATATVKSSEGLPVANQAVVFSTSGDTTPTPPAATTGPDGTATTTIKASNTADVETVFANSGGITGTTTLTESGPATSITLALNPDVIRANGTSTSTATATVKDAAGRCVGGDTVAFTSNPSAPTGPTPGPTTDNGDGTYKSTILSSTTPGVYTIKADDTSPGTTETPATQTLTQFGPANTVTLAPPTITLTADGTSTASLTATVKDANGVGVRDDTVVFSSSGDATFGPVTNNNDGTYTTTVKASKTADTETLTATAETKQGTAQLTENPGPAGTVTVVVNPDTINANGTDTTTATATVKDANNNLIKNETVTFSTNGDVTFSAVTNHNDGTYTSTITASTTADTETIKATTSNGKFGTDTLTEEPGNTSTLTLALNPGSIAANGTDTSTATATLKDAQGNGVPGVTVGFGTSGDVTFNPATAKTDSTGKATSTIKASTTPGTETITANGGGKTDQKPLVEYGPASTVTVALNPNSITADGTSTSTATATVTDAGGRAVLNETVTFTTSGDAKIGATTNNGDGTYKATITASKTADTETITAKTSNNKSNTATLTETAGPPQVTVTLQPSSIPADGVATSTATAKVADVNGNVYKNETVVFSTSGDAKVGTTTNNNDGTYKATVTASTTADQETITATDTTPNPDITGTALLTETPTGATLHPVPPARIFDTRPAGGGGPIFQGQSRKVQVAGKGGVPATGVSAVVMNVTGTGGTTNTFLTVFPSDPRPNASNVNVPAGRDVPNLVTVPLASDGSVLVYNNAGEINVIFDVTGWFDDGTGQAAGQYTALTPARILDTRTDNNQHKPLTQGEKRTVPVAGHGGVPATGATAVVLNLTATQASTNTFLAVFPSGNPPGVSNVNAVPGEDTPNLVVVPLAPDGSVQLYNNAGTVDAIFDVAGWFGNAAAAKFTGLTPSRIFDSRSTTPLGQGETRTITVTGKGNVPSTGVKAVVLNVTATQGTVKTFLTVFPSGNRPEASNLNVPPGRDIANLVFATVNQADGTVKLYNNAGTTHVIFDVVGWYG